MKAFYILFPLFILSFNTVFGCDFMAMIARDGTVISDFSDPSDATQYDYNSVEDYFEFLKERSVVQADGYGVVYYKENSNEIPYNIENPFDETNQAFYLWGELDNCWYGNDWHQSDEYGYRWQDSNDPGDINFEWIDFDETSWTQVQFSHNDQASIDTIALPFEFSFYGQDFESCIVNPNGWIGFGDDNDTYTNTLLPDATAPLIAIFPFWDDLDPIDDDNSTGGGNVYYHVNSDRLVILFDSVKHWDELGEYTFQVVLHLNGDIRFNYQSMDDETNLATIGIQNGNGDVGLQIAYNENYLTDELSIDISTEEYPEPLDTAQTYISSSVNEAVIVLGHDRNRASGSEGSNSQHPYRFEWGGKTYSLQHNGFFGYKEQMKWFCEQVNPNWFENHPLNWDSNTADDLNTVCDTELLLHYLMANIIENDGNAINGLFSALNNTDVNGTDFQSKFRTHYTDGYHSTNTTNIVFTDGESLYLFKNSPQEWDDYKVSFKEFDNGLVAVKTQEVIDEALEIPQYSIVHIPLNGNITIFDDFINYAPNNTELKPFHSGTNWVGFPVLENINGTPIEDVFFPFTDNIDIESIDILNVDGNITYWNIQSTDWIYESGFTTLTSTEGYKVTLPEDYDNYYLSITGDRIPENTPVPLNPGINWVTYLIDESQPPTEAFNQEVLDHLIMVKAEDWFATYQNGTFICNQTCTEAYMDGGDYWDCFQIEYGSMVEIVLDEYATLVWNNPNSDGIPTDPHYPTVSEKFPFKKKPDYIPVLIESIENGENIVEIGAKRGDEIVGGEVVGEYPIHFRLYDRSLYNITFEVVTIEDGLGRQANQEQTKKTLNVSNLRVDNGIVYVNLKETESIQNETPNKFSLVSVYPNPFNPSTVISFSVETTDRLSLQIYNINGQLVETLIEGNVDAGYHQVTWDGSQQSSGVYFVNLTNGNQVEQQKIMLLK